MGSPTAGVMFDRFQGCLLGLALGDALGAPYEGGVLERLLWRLVGTTREGHMRWTDDTQMSLDLVDSIIAIGAIDCDDIAGRFAAGYCWSRGYGPGAAKVLKRIARGEDWRVASRAVYPEGSYGNGGAMRSPAIGLFLAGRPEELSHAVRQVSMITHAHPMAIEGALLVASATALALVRPDPLEIIARLRQTARLDVYQRKLLIAQRWLTAGEEPPARALAAGLGNSLAASDSCVTSIYIALRYLTQPFLEMLRCVAAAGGDVDTIGAMAGAIWGAANGIGGLPEAELARLEQRERLMDAAKRLHQSTRL
ncbi:ADP-ribosylglycohydrolase family protein [Massilia glaciei]|uniref:ADP-ribosylglycohydrolase family protein n=1 Tax=Massilia glaciei TaxID=1524097 RepID=A0A2U2HFM7_9BURK|nr:ADP-ribosylglycohydrolase family protein [Massilia glaciei]PWF43163.1 ADP-ribosylglycohydrolase family protein [Massilia glaciei]